MKPEFRAMALAAGLLVLVGCTLTQSELRNKDGNSRTIIGGKRLIAPKSCLLRVAIVTRPAKDEVINTLLWQAADEQLVAPEIRRGLDANGLRIGILTGDLPKEVSALFNDRQRQKIEEISVVNPCDEPSLIALGSAQHLSLLTSKPDQSVAGKNYEDAHGFVRMTARYADAGAVGLHIVPEVQHGPFQQLWTTAPAISPNTPREFIPKHGQQQDTFRDLAASLTLKPGQIAVLGNLPEKRGSLGDFLFSAVEPNSDRALQKVVLVWANRADSLPSAQPSLAPVLQPVEVPETTTDTSEPDKKSRSDPVTPAQDATTAAKTRR
jgi:hypothetical protein